MRVSTIHRPRLQPTGRLAIMSVAAWLHVLIAIVSLYLGFGMKTEMAAATMTKGHRSE